jgi:hypothetical protein
MLQQETFLGFSEVKQSGAGNVWTAYSSFSDGTKLDWIFDFDRIEYVEWGVFFCSIYSSSGSSTYNPLFLFFRGVKFSFDFYGWEHPATLSKISAQERGTWILQFQQIMNFQHSAAGAMGCIREFVEDQIAGNVFQNLTVFQTQLYGCSSPYAYSNGTFYFNPEAVRFIYRAF